MPSEATLFAARPNVVEIDLDALKSNLEIVAKLVRPGTHIIASVKGHAYGLGLIEVARTLENCGVSAFSTGSLEDAVALREAGIRGEIVMFGGALPAAMPDFVAVGLIPTAHTFEIAEAVSRTARTRYPVYVKIDVGFGRLGIPLKHAIAFVSAVASLPNIEVRGVYTHVPFSDENGRRWASERLLAFDRLLRTLKASGFDIPVTQARASACLLGGLDDSCNAINPGAMLYGRSPLQTGLSDIEVHLRPVLKSVRTKIIHISGDAGDTMTEYPSRHAGEVRRATGVVPFGRVDGNRAAANGLSAHMLVNGIKARVLGISSEHCVIDLSDVETAAIGDDVTIIGTSGSEIITLSDVANFQGTTGSDILLAMSGRLQRRFIDSSLQRGV